MINQSRCKVSVKRCEDDFFFWCMYFSLRSPTRIEIILPLLTVTVMRKEYLPTTPYVMRHRVNSVAVTAGRQHGVECILHGEIMSSLFLYSCFS